jgi:3-oxoacyl-(acyl-carrier-protein) synthase
LAEALARGVAPANVGLEDPDVDERVAFVRTTRDLPSRASGRVGLKLSSGFGGIVAALVLAT